MNRSSREALQAGRRIRVLVVDDSVVIRQLVTHAIEPDPQLEIVGVAANGGIALTKIVQTNPDVVTLDIEMPEMDGLETLRRIRKDFPKLRVVMFSTLTQRGAAITLDALSLGADDYVTKVSNEGSLDRSLTRLREELIPKIKQFFTLEGGLIDRGKPMGQAPASGSAAQTGYLHSPRKTSTSALPASSEPPRVVVIGVSTGGPNALAVVLPQFPKDFPLPILVVQHMPPLFTRLLAERLSGSCPLAVSEGSDGERVEAGKILIAPGDFHMKVAGVGKPYIKLDQSPQLNSCRPAVDALFASVADVYGGATISVVLTGMGSDGLVGTEVLKAKGAFSIAQDRETSVVWGMPGAIVQANAADVILPLDQITGAILRRVSSLSRPHQQEQSARKEAQWQQR